MSPHTAKASIGSITDWLTNSCNVLIEDSRSLAHALVTIKCITSVEALRKYLALHPNMLTQELKIAQAYELQINEALRMSLLKTELADLSVEQVRLLLEIHDLRSIGNIVVEHEVSGKNSCLFLIFGVATL